MERRCNVPTGVGCSVFESLEAAERVIGVRFLTRCLVAERATPVVFFVGRSTRRRLSGVNLGRWTEPPSVAELP
jgi:hypothetical protein